MEQPNNTLYVTLRVRVRTGGRVFLKREERRVAARKGCVVGAISGRGDLGLRPQDPLSAFIWMRGAPLFDC